MYLFDMGGLLRDACLLLLVSVVATSLILVRVCCVVWVCLVVWVVVCC